MDDGSMERVWKDFGKQTQAGKLLYNLYGMRFRPENYVNYPKLKIKSASDKQSDKNALNSKKTNTNLQTATEKIEYPVNIPRNKYNFNKLDFLPKRKGEKAIKDELNEIKNDRVNQLQRHSYKNNINRGNEISKLQDKFMFQERTVMPKGARLPGVKREIESEHIEEEKAYNYNQNKNIKFDKDSKREEMDYLYGQIMKEIDERYSYMEEMKKLGKDVDMIMMNEIKERIDELKKIQKMKTEYDNKHK